MTLDITPLVKATRLLEEGIIRYQSDESDIQIRDGLIQRFEFSYELSHKILKRFLKSVSATPQEFDEADFSYLIRSANEQGLLLGDWSEWKKYRQMRSKTSHAYGEKVAIEVVTEIPKFLEEISYLVQQLLIRTNGQT